MLIFQSGNDFIEISTDISNGSMPRKYLPIDTHVIEISKLKMLIKQIPKVMSYSKRNNTIPYLPIHPISYRKKWQYDDEAYDYLHNVAKKLKDMNYILNVNKLDLIDAVTKAHIAMDVISNKKNEKELLEQFGHIPSKGEFIESIMNENCPAYVKKETVTPKEAAEIIRKAGGKVVLAHPVAYVHEDDLTLNEILEIIDDMNADGLEANYIYTDRNNTIINEINKWNKLAKDNNLFVTIGSDFHMKDGNHAEIGLENVGVVLDDKIINEILKNIRK